VLGLAPAQPKPESCLALKDEVGAKPEGHREPASIHPLDARCYSVVDEPQGLIFDFILVTNFVRNRSHI